MKILLYIFAGMCIFYYLKGFFTAMTNDVKKQKTQEIGKTFILNNKKDLSMDMDNRPYVNTVIEIVGKNRGGLYRVKTHDNKILTGIAKYNLTKIEKAK